MLSDQIKILKEKQKELQEMIVTCNETKKAARTELTAINKAIKVLENLDFSESDDANE